MNFIHRLNGYNPKNSTHTSLADAIGSAANRADAVINLLQCQFENDEGQTLRHDLIFNSLESVRLDLADIKAIVEDYHEAKNQGK